MSLFATYLFFMRFGLLCFGGGNALMPLYIDELVNGKGWMTLDEFANILSIAQITPGAVGINSATFIGHRLGGTLGALFATLGLLTPSVIFMLIITRHLDRIENNRFLKGLVLGVGPVTIAMMLVAAMAFCEMALFTGKIPWRWFATFSLADIPDGFGARPIAFAICAAATWAVFTSKAKITTVILASAGIGMLVWGLFGKAA